MYFEFDCNYRAKHQLKSQVSHIVNSVKIRVCVEHKKVKLVAITQPIRKCVVRTPVTCVLSNSDHQTSLLLYLFG